MVLLQFNGILGKQLGQELLHLFPKLDVEREELKLELQELPQPPQDNPERVFVLE